MGVVGELGKCFLCGWELEEGEYSRANVRTEHAPWRQVRLCKTCATKVEAVGEARIVSSGENVAVRVEK